MSGVSNEIEFQMWEQHHPSVTVSLHGYVECSSGGDKYYFVLSGDFYRGLKLLRRELGLPCSIRPWEVVCNLKRCLNVVDSDGNAVWFI